MRVSYQQEHELITSVLHRCGAPIEHALVQATWLTEADLRGRSSHGIQRVPMLVSRIRAGLLDPTAQPAFDWRTPSVARVDGHDGFGPVIGQTVVDTAVARAPEAGVVVAAVSRSSHLGLLAPYVERIAAHGLIGLVMTTSEALVHAWGGSHPVVGTNPIAVGIPAGEQPFIFDMATGATSMGNVIAHARANRPLRRGWAVDADGTPTVDPDAALAGAISPFGDAKGYGLGLSIQLLVASLTATAMGTNVHGTLDCEHLSTKGDVIIALDPAAFGVPLDESAVAAYLTAVRKSAADPSIPVHIPGDRSREARQKGLSAGFEVDPDAWRDTTQLLDGGAESDNTHLRVAG